MGCEVHLSDGDVVRLASEPDGIVVTLARALDREPVTDDPHGPLVPRGFALFHDLDSAEVWVNAAQVAAIRPT
jgi:hypothetical protein